MGQLNGQPKIMKAHNERFTRKISKGCSPVQNRTGISGSGDLRTIHCTTGPINLLI